MGYTSEQKISDISKGAKGMSLPAQVALEYFSQGFLSPEQESIIPEFVIGENNHEGSQMLIRLKHPRFVGLITSKGSGKHNKNDLIKVGKNEALSILYWIDKPLGLSSSILGKASDFIHNYKEK